MVLDACYVRVEDMTASARRPFPRIVLEVTFGFRPHCSSLFCGESAWNDVPEMQLSA